MATGGNIPTKRTQSVSFYNTTGVIERHKNIYYVPRIKYSNGLIKHAYMREFEGVCPPSSLYTNIDISSWSPEDRTLRVKGNIDDFRCITNEGACLNYLIIKRRVYSSETNYEEFYYAFFINKASQAGGSSILLELIPDDFTNVFYLHNKDVHSDGTYYDPFNKHMKKCYVNRQHYDRLDITYHIAYLVECSENCVLDLNIQANDVIKITFPNSEEYRKYNLSYLCVIPTDNQSFVIRSGEKDSRRPDITDYNNSVIIENVSKNLSGNYTLINFTYSGAYSRDTEYKIANKEILYSQEETFRYRNQWKKEKLPLIFSNGDETYFTNSELNTLQTHTTPFWQLPFSLVKKMIKASLGYLVLELKSNELLAKYKLNSIDGTSYKKYYTEAGNLVKSKINRPNLVIQFPFIDVPEVLQGYKSDIESFSMDCVVNSSFYIRNGTFSRAEDVYRILNQKALSEYVYSAYLVRNGLINNDEITINQAEKWIRFNATVPFDTTDPQSYATENKYLFDEGLYLAGMFKNPEQVNPDHTEEYGDLVQLIREENQSPYIDANKLLLGLVVSGRSYNNIKVPLPNNTGALPFLRFITFDPVLETEPYQFTTIAIGNYEYVISKLKNINNDSGLMDFRYYMSINNGLKIGIYPKYTGLSNYYLFNEGITFTLANSVPLVSDSYSVYYYQNMSQMKNQFAVTDKNYTFDILQHLLISGPNAAGMAAANKKSGWAALAETGNQVMEMVNESIDYWQSKEITDMNQKAKLADMGVKPDSVKQAGSDSFMDISTEEYNVYYINYEIDRTSYQNIARLFERTGYQVNLYSELHTFDRVGFNFIKLNGFDYEAQITVAQEETIRKIFLDGVTLLHDKTYLTSGHNYEIILDE